ncbi:MAG TPA: hypothetical protein VGH44_00715 [Candidatus Saccharimonadia bacterium]
MSADRTNAKALMEGWIPVLTGSVRNAREKASRGPLINAEEILDRLINVPLQADTEITDQELALLVSVYRSGGRFTKAFRRCGKSALKTRQAFREFVPRTGEVLSYEAVLDLADEIRRLAGLLTVRRGATQGNVTHISGASDPQLAAVAEMAQAMCRQLAEQMARVMGASGYSPISREISGLARMVRLLASVPYLAREGGEIPKDLEPLIQLYQRGGKYAKAINRCANAAALAQGGINGLYEDFSKARVQTHLGMQELLPALEALRAKVLATD